MGVPPPAKQRGAALLIALLAVALATTLALRLIEDQRSTLARTQALTDAERSWQFASGLEGLAAEWIRRARQGQVSDRLLDGQWSAPFAVPGGSVRIRLLSRSGRFNINALADRDPARAEEARQGLARLLGEAGQDVALAQRIHARMRISGPPVRFIHLSELRALAGWGPGVEQRLEPLISVLPDPRSRVDINSAPAEVLVAAIPGLSPEAAARVAAQAPYPRLADVRAQPDIQALRIPDLETRVQVGGDWYLAHAEIVLNGRLQEHVRLLSATGAGYDARYVSTRLP